MRAQVPANKRWVWLLLIALLTTPLALAQQQEEPPEGTTTPPAQPDQESPATGDEDVTVVQPGGQDPDVVAPGDGDDTTVVAQETGFLGLSLLTWFLVLLVIVAIVAVLVWALARPTPRTRVVEEERP